MRRALLLLLLALATAYLRGRAASSQSTNTSETAERSVEASDGFDFPVGIPDAAGYYNAQRFGENNHLGEDWNGNGGDNTDLKDPVGTVDGSYLAHLHLELRYSQGMPIGPGYSTTAAGYAHPPAFIESHRPDAER